MSSKTIAFVRHNWVLVAGAIAALAVVVFFTARLALAFVYFNDPDNVDVDLKEWMTPRFIVMTYDLPKPKVMEILGLPSDAARRLRLGVIAEDLGLTLEELTQMVRNAATEFRVEEQ